MQGHDGEYKMSLDQATEVIVNEYTDRAYIRELLAAGFPLQTRNARFYLEPAGD